VTWVMSNLVSVHLETVLVSVNVPSSCKSFWMKPMEFLGDVAHVESHFGPFSDGVSVRAR
jgi:hypothetical protein